MKIKILFGAIFSICIIMLVNTSSAVEYKTVTDYNTELLESKLEKIKQIIEDINAKSNNLKSLNELQKLSDVLSELKISYFNNPSLLKINWNLPNFILGLILSIIGTIIGIIYGKIFGPLTVFLIKILTAPAILLAKIIEFIANLLPS
ncbi:MAG: hypothetical protein BV457_04610 [Thermoplasmata archaeon M9B1D]|nr:MAG: hypothetical protein BV456_12035 [Thermoplasmata archaeon M8B2D]PNX48013.1 MAG: hypothetical protein BV457_04610 [Thermoplasmata archaeon M9B1D]